MTQEQFFQQHVLTYLEDVISWKTILSLTERAVYSLSEVGLIKKWEPEDREIDEVIESGEYQIIFHRYLLYVMKIKKGNSVIYEYTDEKAYVMKPQPCFLDIF